MAGFDGAIFDVDGVLVDSPHERAWKDALRELMSSEWADIRDDTQWTDERFTPELYQQRLSGKPRMDGARAALEYFGVPDVDRRVQPYADLKQAMLLRLVEAGAFEAYPDALRFVLAVRASGIPTAAASSSKNADRLLSRIRLDSFAERQGLAYDFVNPGMRLLDIFDADLSGRDLAHGKPDPEIFLNAAAELHVAPEESFVVEDASSGIEAAKAGHMAALGVARADDEELLAQAHADLVVTSLDQVDLTALAHRELRVA
jgi:beta-phosphoglucomutase